MKLKYLLILPLLAASLHADSDGDGLSDGFETNTGIYVSGSDTGTDPNNADTDGDGVPDGLEITEDTDPNDPNDFNSFSQSIWSYFSIDETLADTSGNQRPSIEIHNSAQISSGGAMGSSLKIIGVDGHYSTSGGWAEIPDHMLEDGDFTVSFWIKVEILYDHGMNYITLQEHGYEGRVLSFGRPTAGNNYLRLIIPQASNNNIEPGSPAYQQDPAISSLPPNQDWLHYTLTKDNNTYTLYENNDEIFKVELNDGFVHSGSIFLGKQWWRSGVRTGLVGEYSKIRTYKRALSTSEVTALYYSEAPNPDTDGDGLDDEVETNTGIFVSLSDTGSNPNNEDTDGDGLDDGDEVNIHLTNPNNNDTDQDGLLDNIEIALTTNPNSSDSDSDGINDAYESNTGVWVNETNTGTSPLSEDSDSDNIIDSAETNTGVYVSAEDTGTDPNKADSDEDGLNDQVETNTGIYLSETNTGTNPNNPDTDGDGLDDGVETNTGIFVSLSDTGSNPNNEDSDGDNLGDGEEVNIHLTNPNNADTDGDGLSDYDELETHGTQPTLTDSNGDGFGDGVVFNAGLSLSTDYSTLSQDFLSEILSNPTVYNLYSRDAIQDLRPDTTIIEVQNGQATIQLDMHQSNDLQTWSKVGDSISMTVPADSSTMFFRHASSSIDSSDATDPTLETTLEFTFIGTNNHDFGAYYGNEAIISTANIPLYGIGSDNYYQATYQVIEWSSNNPIGGSQYGRPTVTVSTTSSLVGHNLKIRFFKYDPNNANNFSSSGPVLSIDGDALAQQDQTVEAASGIGVASQLGYSVRVWKEAKP